MNEQPKGVVLANLLQVIGNPDYGLSARELRGMSGLSRDDRDLFWPLWIRIDGERRLEIVQTMIEIAEDNVDLDFGEVWFWLLEDQSPAVRAGAVEGLWEDESARAMRRMLELLRDDPSGEVRAAAAVALSRFARLAVLGELETDEGPLRTALLEAVQDQSQPLEVRRRALESAGYFAESEAAQEQLQLAYASNEQLLRESALAGMGRSMLPRWLPVVERELGSPSPALRYEAAHAAGEMAEVARPLLPRLLPLVNDTDTEIALSAIWALGQIGGDGARRVLQRISKSNDSARSEAASEALTELSLDEMPY